MENCIFCKIVKGEIAAVKIYEDADTLVFLDIAPDTEGHSLVIPKKHFENLLDVDKNILQKMIAVTQDTVIRIKNSLHADGFNITMNNNQLAGQIVPHIHFHVIPRYANDGLEMYGPRPKKNSTLSAEELKKIAARIK